MAKKLTITVVNGVEIGTATLGDDGQLTFSSDVVQSIMQAWITRIGPEKAFALFADWSNGYLVGRQTDPPLDAVAASGAVADVVAAGPVKMVERWRGKLAPFGQMSGDRRVFRFADGKWSYRDLPRPASYQRADAPGHDGAVTVGRITSMEITKNGFVGDGDWIDEVAETAEAKGLLRKGVLYPSVDLDEYEFQYETEDGRLIDEMTDAEFEEWFNSGEEPVLAFTVGRVGKVTFLAFEAFPQTTLELYEGAATADAVTASGADQGDEQSAAEVTDAAARLARDLDLEVEELVAVVAAGKDQLGPLYPPERWFGDPELTEMTPITVIDEGPDRGKVFGHLADRDCHMSFLSNQQCVLPPEDGGFNWFHRGEIKTAEGTMVAVGLVSAGTGHADLSRSASEAAAHYDNTGRQVAQVRAGRDKFGTWISGSLVPEATPEQVQMLRRSPLSGDWRVVGSGRELVHALCVNMPGFPVVRGRVSQGRAVSMIASGWDGWRQPVVATDDRRINAAVQRAMKRERGRLAIAAEAEAVAATIGRDRATRLAELEVAVHGGS